MKTKNWLSWHAIFELCDRISSRKLKSSRNRFHLFNVFIWAQPESFKGKVRSLGLATIWALFGVHFFLFVTNFHSLFLSLPLSLSPPPPSPMNTPKGVALLQKVSCSCSIMQGGGGSGRSFIVRYQNTSARLQACNESEGGEGVQKLDNNWKYFMNLQCRNSGAPVLYCIFDLTID